MMIMRDPDWTPLRGIDQRRLSEARLQAHYAVQWLARASRAYVPPQPDDQHTNVGWDRALGGFTTHPLKDGAWLSLKITDLTLALHVGEGNMHAQSFSLDGRSDAQARQWLSEQLGARGLDAHALDAPSPYEMPAHAVSQGAAYGPAGLADALAELAAWFGNAEHSLASIQRQMIGRKLAASPLRCWPHHFDLATLTTLPARNAGATGSVGAGLSPGDEYYDEPYFYVSVYPEPDPAALPSLPMLGHWHLRDFMAAIAPAHKIVAAKNQQAETDDFLRAAAAGAIKVFT
ncbi:MAG TPA: DUF5996 family protein [Xanthobacteraceae bacterium]|nr:DUF5996 family protein [Xanthobacteraceae bacterium]